jgi:hypothetical protein
METVQAKALIWDTLKRTWQSATGRIADIFSGRQHYLDQEQDVNLDLANRILSGDISIADAQAQIKENLLRNYTTQYLLGKGGLEQMSQRDWGIIGAQVKKQYDFINRLLIQDIADGKYEDAEKLAARLQRYMQTGNQAFSRAGLEATPANTRLKWVYSPGKKHCTDCTAFNGQVKTKQEWTGLGYHPQSSNLACLGIHCGCKFEEVDG